jgi:hypothetical protein
MIVKSDIVPKMCSIFIKNVVAITLYPFIFVRKDRANNFWLINHEKIHLAQQKELWIIGFYILYLHDWIRGLIIYKNNLTAYKQIRFEQEAYEHQANLKYLEHRRPYAYRKYKIYNLKD